MPVSEEQGTAVVDNAGVSYAISEVERERIENECVYHAPTQSQIERYKELRAMEKHVKLQCLLLAPRSRELSAALTDFDKAFMMVRAAIARNEPDALAEE